MEFFGRITKVSEDLPRSNGEISRQYVIKDPNSNKSIVFDVYSRQRNERLGLKVGLAGTLDFDIEAREWNGRIYNRIDFNAFRKYNPEAEVDQATETESERKEAEVKEALDNATKEEDGLPF